MDDNFMCKDVHKSERDILLYSNKNIYEYSLNNFDSMDLYDKIYKRLILKTDKVGLTDLNYNEYKIMKENLFNKK